MKCSNAAGGPFHWTQCSEMVLCQYCEIYKRLGVTPEMIQWVKENVGIAADDDPTGHALYRALTGKGVDDED